MTINKKIGFYLNWAREIDFYSSTLQKIDLSKVVFIINDLNKSIISHKIEQKIIKEILIKKNYKFCLLSEILGKIKFDILISTGDLGISKITIRSFLKYVYRRTIGELLILLKLNLFFQNKFNIKIKVGGVKASLYEEFFVENLISFNSVKFPNGLDRNIKHYPNNKWKNVFDIYLAASLVEENLIKKKFKNKKIFLSGYPRFFKNTHNNLEYLKQEFKFDTKRKNIICLPTERIMSMQNENAIYKYLKFLKNLQLNFNLILRPHPKLQLVKPKYFEILKNSEIKLDLDPKRRIEDLIRLSDLVIVDYGSSVLEGIYLNKRIAFYEWPHEKDFKIIYDKENCLDYIIRKKFNFKFFDFNDDKCTNLAVQNIILDKTYLDGIKTLETKLFGSKKIKFDPSVIIDSYYD